MGYELRELKEAVDLSLLTSQPKGKAKSGRELRGGLLLLKERKWILLAEFFVARKVEHDFGFEASVCGAMG